VSLGGFAQAPEGKGKPADAGRSPIVQFPVPQQSVGVMHAVSLIQSQRPAAPPPSMTAPASASSGIGHAFGNGNASGIGQVAKSPGNSMAIAQIEKEPLGDSRADDGKHYSLQAVLPLAPGGFPAIQKSVPIPECLGR